jgi:hypothetical protein
MADGSMEEGSMEEGYMPDIADGSIEEESMPDIADGSIEEESMPDIADGSIEEGSMPDIAAAIAASISVSLTASKHGTYCWQVGSQNSGIVSQKPGAAATHATHGSQAVQDSGASEHAG